MIKDYKSYTKRWQANCKDIHASLVGIMRHLADVLIICQIHENRAWVMELTYYISVLSAVVIAEHCTPVGGLALLCILLLHVSKLRWVFFIKKPFCWRRHEDALELAVFYLFHTDDKITYEGVSCCNSISIRFLSEVPNFETLGALSIIHMSEHVLLSRL